MEEPFSIALMPELRLEHFLASTLQLSLQFFRMIEPLFDQLQNIMELLLTKHVIEQTNIERLQ